MTERPTFDAQDEDDRLLAILGGHFEPVLPGVEALDAGQRQTGPLATQIGVDVSRTVQAADLGAVAVVPSDDGTGEGVDLHHPRDARTIDHVRFRPAQRTHHHVGWISYR